MKKARRCGEPWNGRRWLVQISSSGEAARWVTYPAFSSRKRPGSARDIGDATTDLAQLPARLPAFGQ